MTAPCSQKVTSEVEIFGYGYTWRLPHYRCASSSLLLLLAVPAGLSAPGGDLVDAAHVLPEAAVGGEPGGADGAGERLLPRVLPLVRSQRRLVLQTLLAVAGRVGGGQFNKIGNVNFTVKIFYQGALVKLFNEKQYNRTSKHQMWPT